jgi:2-polyprenyl-3-methyl-5-hydroxy-6-metoxy-1,4-benzoquinol methylase
MGWLATLDRRQRLPELMDEPGLDPTAHRTALADLARINRFSFSADILWPPLRRLALENGNAPLRVLDIASGGGDVPIRLWQRTQRAGLAMAFECCDISATAMVTATRNAERAGAKLDFFTHDVLALPLPEKYDAVTCSLFLHHLEEAEAVRVLERMRQAARHLVLVNDLDRSAIGYALAWAGTRILSRSPIVHYDGPVSVRAAFTPKEARRLAERAGWANTAIGRRWPFRFLMQGKPR